MTARFHTVNTPAMVDFKLPVAEQLAHEIPRKLTIGSMSCTRQNEHTMASRPGWQIEQVKV